MGGSSTKKGGGKNKAADAQARIAQHLVEQTDPLRAGLVGRSAQFLGVPASGSTMSGGSGKDGAMRRMAGDVIPGVQTSGPTGMGMVTNTPAYAEFKRATGDRFDQARESAISRLPAGGALTEALVGLDGQQAGALSQGAGALYEDEVNRALSLATGGSAQGMSGLGQAAAVQAQVAANRASATQDKYQSIGSGLGTVFGGK